MELGKFGADRGAVGEVTDDEGRRGIGWETRRGDARGEVGAEAFPETVGLKATGTEFSPVHHVLVALLVLVDKVQVSLDADLCPSEALQFCTEGEFSHVSDGSVYLVL